MFYPQGNFYPQGSFHPQGNFGPQGFPFAGTAYGYPQQTPITSPASYWQHPAQQQFALQQPATLQLLAHQLAAQQLAAQLPSSVNGINGLSNGVSSFAGAWPQQISPEQQLRQQPQHQLLQQLAQYHYLVAQQLTQLAAQQAFQTPGSPYVGQFIPGQVGANFVPGITMH
jgi:hypothetical protein